MKVRKLWLAAGTGAERGAPQHFGLTSSVLSVPGRTRYYRSSLFDMVRKWPKAEGAAGSGAGDAIRQQADT